MAKGTLEQSQTNLADPTEPGAVLHVAAASEPVHVLLSCHTHISHKQSKWFKCDVKCHFCEPDQSKLL